jgi:predicted lipoprotein with Yx(FWY)xxD motif
MKKMSLFIVAVMTLITLKTAFATSPDVTVMNKEGIGSYLTDGNGRTLYWNKKDSPGQSRVVGKFIEIWPPFFNGAILAASPEMRSKDFGMIIRQDGKKQNTFRSYPLYYYSMDKQPGDTKGEKILNVWFVIDPGKFHLTETESVGYSKTEGTED